jgi:hypothetical protein
MNTDALVELERKLKKSIDIDMSINDLRLIVSSLNALEYLADECGEAYAFTDETRELRDRLSGLYHDEIGGEQAFDPFATRRGA